MSDNSALLLSIVAALIPTLFYTGLIYWVDQYEKEPLWLLVAAFLWGAIPSILIAYVFNTVFAIPVYAVAGQETGNLLAAIFIAPPVEETIKGLALLGILFRWRHEIDSPLDGIIYGATVGMGFAMVENVVYFMDNLVTGGTEAWGINIFMRGVIFGLNHALFSSMTGLGIAVARLSGKTAVRILIPIGGWFMAVFSHAFHNFAVTLDNLLWIVAVLVDWGGVWALVVIIVWALIQEQRWLKQYLREEVWLGILTINQYQTACSSPSRLRRNFKLLLVRGPRVYSKSVRFYHRCSKLAYNKHHQTLFHDEQSALMIEKLRQEIIQLGRSGL